MSGVQLTMQTPAVASAGHDPGGAAGLCAALPAQTSRRPDKPLALTDWPNPRANVYTRCWENKSAQGRGRCCIFDLWVGFLGNFVRS